MKRPAVSVAMTTFNGEKFLSEQLDSILENLTEEDEIIISDDGSSDGTLRILKEYSESYPGITVVEGPHKGIKQNFANAMRRCTNDIIFLSDQDDIWERGKTETVLREFRDPLCMVVNHNGMMTDEYGESLGKTLFQWRSSRSGIVKNIWKNSYVGCCMAFRKTLLEAVLPVPEDIEMHDQWIGLLGEMRGKSVFLEDCLIRYRRHENNASGLSHHSFGTMIQKRMALISALLKRRSAFGSKER